MDVEVVKVVVVERLRDDPLEGHRLILISCTLGARRYGDPHADWASGYLDLWGA